MPSLVFRRCCRLVIVFCTACGCLAGPGTAGVAPGPPAEVEVEVDELHGMSSEALLGELVNRGRALSETMWIPRLCNFPWSARPMPPKEYESFRDVQSEIVQRGKEMVDPLLEFLDVELKTIRSEANGGHRLDFTRYILTMLARIGDPAILPHLIDLLESPEVADPNADANVASLQWTRTDQVQSAVLQHLAILTAVQFSGRIDPFWVQNEFCIPATGDWFLGEKVDDYEAIAAQYRRWIEVYSLDRHRWIERSINFAREHLASGDPPRVRVALRFLQATILYPADPLRPWRDDDPHATLSQLAEYVRSLMEEPVDEEMPTWHPSHPRSWLSELCHYGPLAREHEQLLVDLVRGHRTNNWGGYRQLRRVGGDVIMDFLVDHMPLVHERAEAIRNDPSTPRGLPGGDERLAWLSADRDLLVAFDRWVGRRFDTIEERIEWWEQNREKPEQQRFREHLPLLIDQVADGDVQAGWILQLLVPGCRSMSALGGVDPTCVREHLEELIYDEELHLFRFEGEEIMHGWP